MFFVVDASVPQCGLELEIAFVVGDEMEVQKILCALMLEELETRILEALQLFVIHF